jgi:hypothetical protein
MTICRGSRPKKCDVSLNDWLACGGAVCCELHFQQNARVHVVQCFGWYVEKKEGRTLLQLARHRSAERMTMCGSVKKKT